jgi:hypothetical protein
MAISPGGVVMERIAHKVKALERQWKEFYDKAAKPGNCQFCGGARIWWNEWRRRQPEQGS